MQSPPFARQAVSIRRTPVASQFMALALATASMLSGQSAGVSTTSIPVYGQAVFDASGNQYYLNGPITPGSAQPQSGGGTCTVGSPGFLGPGFLQETCPDAQIVKLDPSGNPIFGTYLGGPAADYGKALAVDAAGNVFLTGSTGGQFPATPGSAIPASTASTTFAARLSSDGSAFAYVTYLPAVITSVTAIAIDAQDNAYITGRTGNTGSGAAAVVKVSPDGSAILDSITLAPGSLGTAIAIDPSGNAIVTGAAAQSNFPVSPAAIQSSVNGASNLFLAKLDPSGNILAATYLGGSGIDAPAAVQTDSSGNIYVAGSTTSPDFPATANVFETSPIVPLWSNSGASGFAAKINSALTSLLWSTYVPSQGGVTQMALGLSGDVYLSGMTGGTFPITASAPQPCFANSSAGFILHLNAQGALADSTYVNDPPEYNSINGIYGLRPISGSSVQVIFQYAGTNDSAVFQFGGPGYTAPACVSSTVLNAATQYGASPFSYVAPTEILTLTGFGMGPVTGVAAQANSKGAYPTELAGVQVLFDGTPAPVLYAQSEQINFIAPATSVNSSSANIQVVYNKQALELVPVFLAAASPGIFRAQPGVSTEAFAANQDGTPNGPDNPAAPGSVVSILATGLGPTSPACAVGGPNVPYETGLASGVTAIVTAGPVTYAGSAPGYACGVERVRFQLPSEAAPGIFSFALSSNTTQSNAALQTPALATIFVGN